MTVTGTGSLWNLGNQQLVIGNFGGYNNQLTINGGVVTNLATLSVGNGGCSAFGNSVLVTNGGALFVNGGT